MTYQIRVWCRDCCGEDFLGCFDGGSETLDEEFRSKKSAIKFADEYTKDSTINYEIVVKQKKKEEKAWWSGIPLWEGEPKPLPEPLIPMPVLDEWGRKNGELFLENWQFDILKSTKKLNIPFSQPLSPVMRNIEEIPLETMKSYNTYEIAYSKPPFSVMGVRKI